MYRPHRNCTHVVEHAQRDYAADCVGNDDDGDDGDDDDVGINDDGTIATTDDIPLTFLVRRT